MEECRPTVHKRDVTFFFLVSLIKKSRFLTVDHLRGFCHNYIVFECAQAPNHKSGWLNKGINYACFVSMCAAEMKNSRKNNMHK